MKNTFIIILFALLSFNAHSQRSIDSTDHDTFKTAIGWDICDKENAKGEITSDGYLIEHKKKEGSYTFFKKMTVDHSKDFSFEVSLTQKSGVTDFGHGLIWGMKDWDDYCSFIISPSGYYKINASIAKKSTELVPWKKDEIVKTEGENILLIEKKSGDVNFYVNGKKVYTATVGTYKIGGQYFGIILYSQKQVNVKYVKAKGVYKKLNLVANATRGYKRENLGPNINSSSNETSPVISADGKILYFARDIETSGQKSDIWYSKLESNGTWGPAINMGFPLNNSGPNAIISVSADNNQLYISNTYKEDGSAFSIGMSVSKNTANGWQVPTKVDQANYYNDHKYVFNYFSQDRKHLLQALQRKDSKGDSDIYYSYQKSDGSYSEPTNIGDVINTLGAETTPFIAADNKTMYFSSNGHAGYGDNDVFVTRRLDETWKNWSEPENLGPEINSSEWDAYFSIPASGEEAYMVTEKNSLGKTDIVKIKLSEQARPKPVVLISGRVLNKKTNEPLSANIKYFDLQTNEDAGNAISNPSTGEYNIILQSGKKYGFRAEKENFYAVNDMLDVTNLSGYKEIRKDLFLVPIEVGQSIRLNNVFFDFNKSDLKPESYSELDRLVDFLKNNGKMEIEIGGHTDNVGADDYNIKLSQQRTESVVNYLVSKGINKARLQAKGYGKNKPVATNDTEEGKSSNRRVEFTIIKQ